jgi:hypothetical protein
MWRSPANHPAAAAPAKAKAKGDRFDTNEKQILSYNPA